MSHPAKADELVELPGDELGWCGPTARIANLFPTAHRLVIGRGKGVRPGRYSRPTRLEEVAS